MSQPRPEEGTPRQEPTPDTGVEAVAAVYAKALLGATGRAGQTEAILEELHSLLCDVLDCHPQLERILGSWLVAHEQTMGVLDRVFGGRMTPLLLNFLKVLSKHGRLGYLRAIYRAALAQWEAQRGVVRVELVTATPMEDGLLANVQQMLRTALGREPAVRPVVDPNLIGGAVLRIGDTVFDASVATQLEKLRQHMIDRSVHEIQSRRDRFRNSAGN